MEEKCLRSLLSGPTGAACQWWIYDVEETLTTELVFIFNVGVRPRTECQKVWCSTSSQRCSLRLRSGFSAGHGSLSTKSLGEPCLHGACYVCTGAPSC